jgi:TonB-dependent SusC/RagA subfamily outer membrane receptor
MRKIILPVLLVFFYTELITAQTKDEPVELKNFFISIKSGMFTATTTLNMEFYNPNTKVLDGEYNFSLKEGQVITGFALDINGFMRDGVIVDKQKGRVAYENTIRRRVDPGLLEMTAGNNYRARIYPMPAKGVRKIKIVITENLTIKENSLQYHLPLDISYPIKQFSVYISAEAAGDHSPFIKDGILKKSSFIKEKTLFTLQYTEKDSEIKQPLSFNIPLESKKIILCKRTTDSITGFGIHLKPEMEKLKATSFSSATVFWDISSSVAKRDIKKDIQFLENIIEDKELTDLTVVAFSNAVHEIKEFKGKSIANSVRRFLLSQIADGGTQLGALDCSRFNTDVYFLFSDGLSNFGSDKINAIRKPIHCITSSATTNHTLLKRIAEQTGGRYIDLYSTEIKKALSEFNNLQKNLLYVQSGSKMIPANISLPIAFDDWVTFSGEVNTKTDTLIFAFGDNGRVLKYETVYLKEIETCIDVSTDTVNILQQYEKLLKDNDETALLAFAKKNKLVSAASSFIVLDNVEDYIQYGIEPPSDLMAEYTKRLYVVKQKEEQQKTDEANAIIDNLRKSVVLYNERISWWNKNEPLISFQEVERKNEERLSINNNAGDKQNETSAKPENNGNADAFKLSNNSLNEVVVVGYGSQRRRDLTGAVASIRSSELSVSGGMNLQQALQGKVAGVMVVQNNGSPGAAPKIFIRGAGTLGAGREPLYILDGMAVDGDLIAAININDIESVSVYKDIQASALFSSRASNGAIVITTKRGFRNSNQYIQGVAKYKDLDDVEYVTELKEVNKEMIYKNYLNMKDSLGKEPAFYFDVAQLLFESGDKEKALRVLTNLTELDNESHQLLRAMGYVLESWKMYDEAITVYKKVLLIKEEEPQSYRDLALTYERKGDHQQAIDILYNCLTKNWYQYANRYRGLKSLLLNEMNAIILQRSKTLDLSKINGGIIKPLPVDLRIVIDWNKDETDIDLHIIEPGGQECSYQNHNTKNGGRLSEDFTQGYGPEEYQIKQAKKGKYAIRVKYYGDRYQKQQVPSFIKLTIYKNFGRPDQTVTIENLIMDYQTGMVEIGEVKF